MEGSFHLICRPGLLPLPYALLQPGSGNPGHARRRFFSGVRIANIFRTSAISMGKGMIFFGAGD